MKNKILSLVLALLMAASSASAVLANDVVAIDETAEEVAVAEEVEAGQYDKAIAFLANYGIMKGITDNDFGAELDVQRYQMALFVARISTGWIHDHQWLNAPENWTAFTDISEGPAANYWGALSYASQAGIIEGYGNGKFGPEDQITYQNALTMVVRTLGYDGLDWPWGYIQKAVELGLTEGITGVSYTDNLTRGEVAQIIYNAMFAKMKNGSNLALKNFGIEFGWEKVVITASDLNTFVADKEDAEKKLINDTTPYWKNSNKPEAGFVTFQLLKDDGSLADDVYYVQASELGLKGDHDDEAAVGEAYYVLFEKDENGLAKVAAYESLKLDTIWNEGKTDDNGDEQDYAIQEFLEDYALVGKYTGNEYLNVTKSTDDEIMVFASTGVITEEYINGNLVAIDWETGDILVPQDQNDDDKITEDDKVDGEYVYDVEWNYNDVTGKYWRYTYDKKYEHVIGIDKMTEKEFSDTYAKYFTTDKNTYEGFATTVDKIATSAYASLEIFDTNLDGVADRGIYESYRLGYFYEDKASDSKSYRIDALDAFDISKDAAKVVDGSVTNIANFNTIQEGIKDKDDVNRAWFVEGYEPNVKYDADGEAVGYESAYVIYNYDAETGAIKVVKVIDGSDEDSFVKTGVLRAYNLTNGTITIGEDTYYVNNYNELEGNPFKYVTEKFATKALYTAKLRSLFNQFVQYVVVDNELVEVKAVKADKGDELIVVESYAGLSSDGYIVVNGYSTDDLVYDQFRIASYDGWMKGDYYYYLTDKEAAESFTKGAIYKITSYDAEEDVYNVYLAGEFGNYYGSNNEDYDYYWVDGNEASKTLFVINDGYIIKYTGYDSDNDERAFVNKVDGKWYYKKGTADEKELKTEEERYNYYGYDTTKTSYIKMNDGDKYVLVRTDLFGNKHVASVDVYNDKLNEDVVIEGDLYNNPNNDLFVFVNCWAKNLYNSYNAGLVVLLDDRYYSASYNGTGSEDWYLLGASEYTISTVDLLTGELDAVMSATNKKYDEGMMYHTQGTVLVDEHDEGHWVTPAGVEAAIEALYDGDTYLTSQFNAYTYKAIYKTNDDKHKGEIEKMLLAIEGSIDGNVAYRGDKVKGVTYRVISIDEEGYVTKIDDSVYGNKDGAKLDSYITKNSYTSLPAFYVYNVETKNIVIYLVESAAVSTTTTTKLEWTDAVVVKEYTDAKIKAQLGFTTTKVNGEITALNVDGVKFFFEGDAACDSTRHSLIAERGYAFGLANDHFAAKYTVSYGTYNYTVENSDWVKDIIYKTVVDAEYLMADGKTACDECELVKSIYIPFTNDIVVKVTEDGANAAQVDVEIGAADDNGFILSVKLDAAWDIELDSDGDVKTAKLVVTKEAGEFFSPEYDVTAFGGYVADLLN